MKKIWLGMLLPILTMVLVTSCENDTDSNPTFHENTTGFVLNMPANAANNVLDLLATNELKFTTSQPDYGGMPLSVNYDLEMSFEDFTSEDPVYTVLTSSTSTVIGVSGSKLNNAVVTMFQDANEGVEYPSGEVRDIYVRLHANVNGLELGNCYSNVIKLQVVATYQAPDIALPETLYVCGSSIGEGWKTWKPLAKTFGLDGHYFAMVYLSDGAEFKWGTYPEQWLGYADVNKFNDEVGAGLSDNGGNIKVATGGWYVLCFDAKINGEVIDYTLNVYPGAVYIIGNATSSWDDSDPASQLTAPADATGEWVSPAFTGGGEMRAYVKVGTYEWWRTEFTLFEGSLYWRNVDIPENWAANVGSDYSVQVLGGQKLYIKFGTPGVDANDTGVVK